MARVVQGGSFLRVQRSGRRRFLLVLLTVAATALTALVLAPGTNAAARTPAPPEIRYAYGFDSVASGRVANLQAATGSGYDLLVAGSYTAAAAGLPAGQGGGTRAVAFSGTGRPGYSGGVGSRGVTSLVPARTPASQAVSVGVVLRTSLPTPIPSTLRTSPNVVQSGLFDHTTQLKLQIGENKKPGCRVKGLTNGARGRSPAVFSPSAAPNVADNAFHTIICTKGADAGGRTTLTLTVDGRDYSTTVSAVGDLAFVAPIQVATNSPSTWQSSDQLYGVVDAMVWATGSSDTAAKVSLTTYLAGLLTP